MIIPQALAPNFATLIVSRFLSGGCACLLSNIISCVIPDVWKDDKARSVPVSTFIVSYLTGATLGAPMFAGVAEHINWRWIFYIQLIIYGAFLPVFWFLLPETRATVILRQREKEFRERKGQRGYAPAKRSYFSLLKAALKAVSKAVYRPLYLLSTEPVLMASTAWCAFSVGTVYLFTQCIEQVFNGVYGWSTYQCGYVQAAMIIGEVLGWIVSFYGSHLYVASAKRNDESPGHPIPEARLYVSIAASIVGTAGGMFVFAWTSYPSIPWIAPAVGLAMVGFGIQIVVSASSDYVIDAYAASTCNASAVTSVVVGENTICGLLPLATKSMYKNLGFQWASSLLALIALFLSAAPIVFVWKGRRFRERSPFVLSGGQSAKRVFAK